jgi:3-phosphoshikimate 1-carboxyvinyltransferase
MESKNITIASLVDSNKRIQGILTPPPDKSITHRALFLAALSPQSSIIRNPLLSGDCRSTLNCFKKLGVPIHVRSNQIRVRSGKKSLDFPYRQFKPAKSSLNCGNSGTTLRLLSGVLSAQPFVSRLIGDVSLSKRPMKRILDPLSAMGAKIQARKGHVAPLVIHGDPHLKAITWKSPVASAQVKSAILLAGLFAKGKTTVIEPHLSRDHTERMLPGLGVKLQRSSHTVSVIGQGSLKGLHGTIPGDFSSASFFIVAALVVPHSQLTLHKVNLNPTRSGLLKVLKRMGAKIEVRQLRNVCGEPLGTLHIQYSQLKGTTVGGKEIPSLIDEIPILCVAATQAKGWTEIRDAQELRVKETDRIRAVVSELKKLGANIQEKKAGCVIQGAHPLVGSPVVTYSDHRMAMSLAVAALVARGKTTIQGFDCVKISYPHFLSDLKKIIGKYPGESMVA